MDDNDYVDYGEDQYDEYCNDENIEPENVNNIINYQLLMEDDFEEERNEKINDFCQLTNLSADQAALVLMSYNWNTDKLESEWFENQYKIKVNAGIAQRPKKAEEINKFFSDKNEE